MRNDRLYTAVLIVVLICGVLGGVILLDYLVD